MPNPWFRLYGEFANDAKVQMMSEADQRRFVMLLCVRCNGETKPISDDEIAFQLRISEDEATKTKQVLINTGLIVGDWMLTTALETEPERPLAHVWRAIRSRIFQRDDYTCQYCGERGKKLECDHVIPVSRGVVHSDNNLVTACFACNRSKRDKLVGEWRKE